MITLMPTFFCSLLIQVINRKLGSIKYPLNFDTDIQKDYGYYQKKKKGLKQEQRLIYFAFSI